MRESLCISAAELLSTKQAISGGVSIVVPEAPASISSEQIESSPSESICGSLGRSSSLYQVMERLFYDRKSDAPRPVRGRRGVIK
jgi:hypothetical protein